MKGICGKEKGKEEGFISYAVAQLDRTPSAWETTEKSVNQIVVFEVALLNITTLPLANLVAEE